MRRFPAACTALTIIIIALLALSACGGGGSTPTPSPSKIVVTPSTMSLTLGQFLGLSAADGNGNVITDTITWKAVDPANPSNPSPYVTVANNGFVCAGTWNSLSNPTVCTPNTNGGVGQASVTATVGTTTSDPITVYTHLAATHVAITSPSIDVANCLSQTKTANFAASADVPNIGVFSWTSTNTGVATVDANGVVTAVGPGQAQIIASVSNGNSNFVTSLPAYFTTCPVAQIKLHTANAATTETSVTLAAAGTSSVTADVFDTRNNPVSNVSLGVASSRPSVATGSSSTITAINPGTTTLTAFCIASPCNPMLPGNPSENVYSNPYLVNVTGTSATTVFAASSQSSSVVPIDTGTNTIGTAVALKDASGNAVTPNSMMFTRDGSVLYVGTSGGLVGINVTSTPSATPANAAVPGKVIAISKDDSTVLTTDGAKVYVQTTITASTGSTTTVSTLPLAGVTSAAYNVEGSKVYIVGNDPSAGNYWTVWGPNITPVLRPLASAKDASFALTGAFGFIAGPGNSVLATSVCNDEPATPNATASTAASPIALGALADGTHMLALDPPYVSLVTLTSDNVGCPPALTLASKDTSLNGAGFGAPSLGLKSPQLILTPDGKRAFVTSNQPGVLLGYNVATQAAAPVQLSGGVSETYTGGVTNDSLQLYVGAGGAVPSVHRVDLTTSLDVQQIPVNITATDGSQLAPDFVAVRPK